MLPTVAILAGGLATRLCSLTQNLPKALLDIAGKPFLFRQLDLLQESRINRVVLCVGHYGDQIQKVLPSGAPWQMTISFSFDGPALLGTGGALRKALPLLSDPFFVMYGDSYLPVSLADVFASFPPDKSGLMTVFKNEGKWDSSNCSFDAGVLYSYNKRNQTPEMRHIDYGLSILRQKVFRDVPSGPFDLADLLQNLSEKRQLAGYEVSRRFYEIGSVEGLEELRNLFASGRSPPLLI